jgi:hypothetical protein
MEGVIGIVRSKDVSIDQVTKVHKLGVEIEKKNDGSLPHWKNGITDQENGKFIEKMYGAQF